MTLPSDSGTADGLFYNVPPATGTQSRVVTPDASVAASPPAAASISSSHLPSKKILMVIGGVVFLMILALGGYLLFHKKQAPAVVQPVPETGNEQQTTPPSNTDQTPTPETPAAVTTPSDWQKQYFGNADCTAVDTCGDSADPERDGLTNVEEHNAGTDPNNADSDQDGLADGDEVHVFGGSPLKAHTAGNDQYTDADNARGAYNPNTNKKYTDDEMTQLKSRIKQYGLHQPTIGALGENALIKYDFVEAGAAPAAPNVKLPQSLDRSPQAMLDRDILRLAAMRKIGAALIKYKAAQRTFPQATAFMDMADKVKPFLTVATNPVDPVNIEPFVYTYQVSQSGLDFTMTYYSESQNQLIKFTAPDAEKSANQEQANLNDDQRIRDLETLKSALLIYSQAHLPVNASISYVFPTVDKYKTELVPNYLSSIPKDPQSDKDYNYQVSAQFDSFTIKAVLENPPTGSTGYLCNQEECRNY